MDGARTRARALTNTPLDAAVPSGPLLSPFAGLRYAPEVAGPLRQLLAPPHTELDHRSRAAFLASSPYVVTHLERPEYGTDPAGEAGPAVLRWLQQGVLVQDSPGLYVARQRRDDGRSQHFLLAALVVRPDDPRVWPHEDVFEQAVTSRLRRLEATGVDSEPVLLVDSDPWPVNWTDPAACGRHVSAATDAEGRPVLDVWHLRDEAVVAQLVQASADHRFLIADGHHRYAAVLRAARRSGTPQLLLVAVVDHSREAVQLGALHRVLPTTAAKDVVLRASALREASVRDATDVHRAGGELGLDEALVLLPDRAVVIECPPQDGHPVGTVGSGAWVDTVVREVGTAGDDVRYLARAEDVWNLVDDETGDRSAIVLPTPDVAALQAVALAGHTLGRKTTSFRPKPLAGSVLRLR